VEARDGGEEASQYPRRGRDASESAEGKGVAVAEPEAHHASHRPPEFRLGHVVGGEQRGAAGDAHGGPTPGDIRPAPERRLQADGIHRERWWHPRASGATSTR
jgi:hypothetical protein